MVQIHYKPQQVTDLVAGEVVGFRASGRSLLDARASGSIVLYDAFGTNPLRYEPVYGAATSDSHGQLAPITLPPSPSVSWNHQ